MVRHAAVNRATKVTVGPSPTPSAIFKLARSSIGGAPVSEAGGCWIVASLASQVLPASVSGKPQLFEGCFLCSIQSAGASLAGVVQMQNTTLPMWRLRGQDPSPAPSNTTTLGCIWRLLNRPNGIPCCVATSCNHGTISAGDGVR